MFPLVPWVINCSVELDGKLPLPLAPGVADWSAQSAGDGMFELSLSSPKGEDSTSDISEEGISEQGRSLPYMGVMVGLDGGGGEDGGRSKADQS